jgi:hypothetical protein
MRMRGLSILETIISVAVLALIILAVGEAVSHTMRTDSMTIGRAGEARSASGLEARLNEEARSATSVFVPPLDVLGQSNSGEDAHEVDFFRKLSGGASAYVAYRFDRASGTVTRYDYLLAGNAPQTSDADLAASGIAAFSPQMLAVGSTGDVVGGQEIAPVTVYYGSLQTAGGNGVVTVSVVTTSGPAAPAQSDTIHLSARSAPTDLAELVSSATPPPGGPHSVSFLIVPKLLKGPWHGGGGGDGNDPGQIHGAAIPGSATFIGQGDSNMTWFDVSRSDPVLQSGLYKFVDSNGRTVQLSVACDGGPCPQFAPLPQNVPGAPKGFVIFRTAQ